MRSRIDPMKKIARILRSHRGLILNWFRAKELIALGAVEGLNNKAKVTTKKAYGFKSYDVINIALYHTLGNLPEPNTTHKFCGATSFLYDLLGGISCQELRIPGITGENLLFL